MLDALALAFVWEESANGADDAWIQAKEREMQERF